MARDGEVNFWWDTETIKLGLGFYGDSKYSYYAKLLENGKEFFGDDVDCYLTLPLIKIRIELAELLTENLVTLEQFLKDS